MQTLSINTGSPEAIDSAAKDAGYEDYADACEVTGTDDLDGEEIGIATMTGPRIILDNGGGTTLQIGEWAHFYPGSAADIGQLADDILVYRRDGNTAGWDGHDDDAVWEPKEGSAGCDIVYLSDLSDLRESDLGGGHTESNLREALITRGVIVVAS